MENSTHRYYFSNFIFVMRYRSFNMYNACIIYTYIYIFVIAVWRVWIFKIILIEIHRFTQDKMQSSIL